MSGFSPIEWPTDSQVTLCRVTWDSAYKDVVKFANDAARDEYFNNLPSSETITLTKMTYLKPNEPIVINTPYSQAYTYNYLFVENPTLPVPGEVTPPKLFYFVTQVSYVAPNTTALTLQLDVWTTYINHCEFGRAYVERGHIGTCVCTNAAGSWDNLDMIKLRRYAGAPEGLDIGSEYPVMSHDWYDISNVYSGGWKIVIYSTTNLAADWGNSTSPNLETATGQSTDGIFNGCNVYMIPVNSLEKFIKNLSNYPWVSKGILGIYAFPGGFLTDGEQVTIGNVTGYFLGTTPDESVVWTSDNIGYKFARYFDERYIRLTKFYTFPYSVIEMTNYTGNSVMLKPQYLHDNTLSIKAMALAAPPNPRIGFYVDEYLSGSEVDNSDDPITYAYATLDINSMQQSRTMELGVNTDIAVWFNNLPQMTVVNDEATLYLASTTNTRSYQYSSSAWAQTKANNSAYLSEYQTRQQLETNQSNKTVQNIADAISGALSTIGGAASGGIAGGLASAAGALTGLISSNMQFSNTQNLTGDLAKQNLDLALWANAGDYQMAISQINATVQDAQLTQPSTSGQMGGDAFALSNGLMGIEVRYKTIDSQSRAIVGEFWLRYGYAVHEFMRLPKNLQVMTYFTYWKTSEIYLTCARASENDKDTIRGIFGKGVTVWSNPDDIGEVDPGVNFVNASYSSYTDI